MRWSAPSEHIPQKLQDWRRAAVLIRIRVTPDELLSRQPRHACPVDPPNWRLVYPRRSTHPWLRLQAGSRGITGGDPRIRTANVYPAGPDLQSGAAHAIAARSPKFGRNGGTRTHDPLSPRQVRYQTALHSDENESKLSIKRFGAQGGTRTHTPLRTSAPEADASTNSATWAMLLPAAAWLCTT